MRVLDTIARDIQRTFGASYIGKVGNNADGRNLLKGEVLSYLGTCRALERFRISTRRPIWKCCRASTGTPLSSI
ncbi:hypothetical protein HMSSN036_24820 [Paenibacillus macerans]|nr:hypothetical protein HMSSN036_24820 [Paenibacillus macerans]